MKPTRLLVALVLTVAALPSLAAAEGSAADQKKLVRQGARQWSAYCGTCHNARPASERAPEEWDTLMLHMRVRANLPADDARALLAFLKAR